MAGGIWVADLHMIMVAYVPFHNALAKRSQSFDNPDDQKTAPHVDAMAGLV